MFWHSYLSISLSLSHLSIYLPTWIFFSVVSYAKLYIGYKTVGRFYLPCLLNLHNNRVRQASLPSSSRWRNCSIKNVNYLPVSQPASVEVVDLELGLSGPGEFVFLTAHYLEPLHKLCPKFVRFFGQMIHGCQKTTIWKVTNSFMRLRGEVSLSVCLLLPTSRHVDKVVLCWGGVKKCPVSPVFLKFGVTFLKTWARLFLLSAALG